MRPFQSIFTCSSIQLYIHAVSNDKKSGAGSGFVLVIIIILITLGSGDGRQGVGSFDEPAECEEGNASKNGSAPCLRRPPAILPDGDLPLLSQSCKIRIMWVGRIGIPGVFPIPTRFGRIWVLGLFPIPILVITIVLGCCRIRTGYFGYFSCHS